MAVGEDPSREVEMESADKVSDKTDNVARSIVGVRSELLPVPRKGLMEAESLTAPVAMLEKLVTCKIGIIVTVKSPTSGGRCPATH